MTDNEIIKALELCSCGINCLEDCPLQNLPHTVDCLKTFLDLVIRQKTEIKRLQKIANPKCQQCVSRTIESAKAEAIKEFVDKNSLGTYDPYTDTFVRKMIFKRNGG